MYYDPISIFFEFLYQLAYFIWDFLAYFYYI